MEEKLSLRMDMQLRNKGFTMIELLLSLSILAIMVLICAPVLNATKKVPIDFVINDIAFKQYEAIVKDEKTIYDDYNTYITFNRKGGINHADTYDIDGTDIIVTLGTGRIYVHDQQQGNDPD